MAFKYGFDKVKESDFELMEPGWYPFRIIEAEEMQSKKGDPMIKVVASCLDVRNVDRQIRHWVVFLPEDSKGAGISKHFVKCIGLPVDKAALVDPVKWVGKKFMGKVIVNEYEGKRNNKFEAISPIHDDAVAEGTPSDDPFGDTE